MRLGNTKSALFCLLAAVAWGTICSMLEFSDAATVFSGFVLGAGWQIVWPYFK
jgi:hypothetical protein